MKKIEFEKMFRFIYDYGDNNCPLYVMVCKKGIYPKGLGNMFHRNPLLPEQMTEKLEECDRYIKSYEEGLESAKKEKAAYIAAIEKWKEEFNPKS